MQRIILRDNDGKEDGAKYSTQLNTIISVFGNESLAIEATEKNSQVYRCRSAKADKLVDPWLSYADGMA